MLEKLNIGSANFGLEYGVSNKRKLGRKEVFSILDLAREKNISGIDTAKTYGDAEIVIGEYFKRRGKIFNVITKLPKKEYHSPYDVEKEVIESLENMNITFIDCVLMHSYETYAQYGKTAVSALQSLRKDGIIGSYGTSVYHPDEVETMVKEVKDDLAIEFPVNLFDQRFMKNNLLRKLKDEGTMLYARSVFLQGLFFLDEEKLTGKFQDVVPKVRRIRELAEEYGIQPECMALLFVASNPLIDGIVFGIDSSEHLSRNICSFAEENIHAFDRLRQYLPEFEISDEDILLPYRWGLN